MSLVMTNIQPQEYLDALNKARQLTDLRRELEAAMVIADVGLAAAQNDQAEIERWMERGESHSECKTRVIAHARSSIAAAFERSDALRKAWS